MEEILRSEWKPVVIEIAEIGREVLKFTFNTPEEFKQWWSRDDTKELPTYGVEMLGNDF